MRTFFTYTKCHGSGNHFVMFDNRNGELDALALDALARAACDSVQGVGGDGMVLLVEREGHYGMRMFNPDGSEAEMCGNGIRCVARAAEEQLGTPQMVFFSGQNDYTIVRTADIFPGIPTYGVDIAVRLSGSDFGFMGAEQQAIEQVIPALHPTLQFTAINVGNPHIVARTEHIDLALLTTLGERVKELTEEFPHGVNVSLVEVRSEESIFVATYERGAGITPSCGTAMTSSATAMVLTGACREGRDIMVRNSGGAVICRTQLHPTISTRLVGNATYVSAGQMCYDGHSFTFREERVFEQERALYAQMLDSL